MPFATIADIALRLARPIPADELVQQQWNSWLGLVERNIRGRVRDLDAQIDAGNLAPARVGDIIVSVIVRHIRNPEGLRQQIASVDDSSVTKIAGDRLPANVRDFELTEAEWEELERGTVTGAFSIRTVPL